MKALEILNKILKEINDDSLFLSEDFIPNLEIKKAINELEALENRSCESCKHLEEKELGLQYSCIFEVCRSCCRNNKDNWESKQ